MGQSLSLALLYLCSHRALGQVPPGGYTNQATVQFSSDTYSVAEGDTATISVYLNATWAPNQPITVSYSTSDGSGQAGVDYTPASGGLDFSSGNTQTFTVSTINNPNNTSYVTVNLILSSPYNCTLGSPSTATLYVYNGASCSGN